MHLIWKSLIILSSLFIVPANADIANAPSVQCDLSDTRNYVECRLKSAGFDKKTTDRILEIVKCESNFIPQQSALYYKKVREVSFGVWQINLPAHPEISKEQVMDVEWSTTWSIDQIKKGNINIWSCAK